MQLTHCDDGARVHLRSDERGTFLIEGRGEGELLERELGPHTHFQLRSAAIAPRLHIAEGCYRLPRMRVERALRIIARCRLTPPARELQARPGRVVPDPLLASAISSRLASDETVLGLVPTRVRRSASSPVVGAFEVSVWLLLTERRLLWIGVSPAGDVVCEALFDRTLRVDAKHLVWANDKQVASSAAADLLLLAEVAQKHGPARLVELARRLSLAADGAISTEAEGLLRSAAAAGDLGACALVYGLALPGATTAVEPDSLALVEWDALARDWQLSAERVERLLERLPCTPRWRGAREELSRLLCELELGRVATPHDKAELELRFAQRLITAGALERAADVLTEVAATMPPLTLADVDVPTNLPKTPWFELRRRLQTLLLQVSEHGGAADHAGRASLELACLRPLNTLALTRAARIAPEVNRHRCATALRLLSQQGALSPLSTSAPTRPLQELPLAQPGPLHEQLHALQEQLLDQLHDPLARQHERFWARVQELAAKTTRPDFATLKLYCERVTEETSPLARAVDETATMLGVGHVDVYISRGHDDVGLRAFSNGTAVLLVGGQHVDPHSRYFMPPAELCFCVAGELAHVRFGHARVAPKDVARGVLDKGRQGLDITLSLLPVVAGLKLADRLGVVTAKLSLPNLGKLVNTAKDVTRAIGSQQRQPASRSDLAHQNETLIDAHRFSQLTADRAGLVGCGDLGSALRGMLLSRTDYVRVVSRLQQQDLLTAIGQQRSTNPAAFDDLLMRVGLLVAFYVSDDYDTLRRAVTAERTTTQVA